ncbi:MAG: MBL fold metallo-hydrolase, partial [Clostridia bacterium]|nr:MBL fold metallo-hydrolase [Clostridia bacterium]
MHYLYVGQGDCEIVVCEGHAMLIDSGESGNENKIIDYIHKCGITSLEYAVATHPHSDHIGAMPYVLESVKVKNLVMTGLPDLLVPTYYCYNQLINIVS